MIDSISKRKIPRDYCYVLKTSQLEELLIKNDIMIHTDLVYSLSNELILSVSYWFPNDNVPYYRLYICAGTVSKKNIKTAKSALVNVVLPELENWLNIILKLPENSTMLNNSPTFYANFINDKAEIQTSFD